MTTTFPVRGKSYAYMDADGNALNLDDSCAIPSAFATTDKAYLCFVPAGSRVTRMLVRNDDLDTGTTVVGQIGYEAADTSQGSLSASVAYFLAASVTIPRAAGMAEMSFDPITFNQDVWITFSITAGPTTTAGNIKVVLDGQAVGVK